MKKVFCLLAACMMLICTVASADLATARCGHHFQLFPKEVDGVKAYSCLCTLGCTMIFDVYPQGCEVTPKATEDGSCPHVFRTDEICKRVSVESASQTSHQAAEWYDCVCELCGEAFEAYVTDGKYYDHHVSHWDGVHIDGEMKHLLVGYCDSCGQLRYEIVNCHRDENGWCYDPLEHIVNQ